MLDGRGKVGVQLNRPASQVSQTHGKDGSATALFGASQPAYQSPRGNGADFGGRSATSKAADYRRTAGTVGRNRVHGGRHCKNIP